MNAAYHYAAAEDLLDQADTAVTAGSFLFADRLVARAHVHAVLATATTVKEARSYRRQPPMSGPSAYQPYAGVPVR